MHQDDARSRCRVQRSAGVGFAEQGIVKPVVGARFPLDRASEALKLIDERGALGKVVLEV